MLTGAIQNGGYINPPYIKRQHRDPYADWDDPQERRNFGEPLHENNDELMMLSPFDYTWATPKKAFQLLGATVVGFVALFMLPVHLIGHPDRPTVPREFEGGLQRELGGPGAVRVGVPGDVNM